MQTLDHVSQFLDMIHTNRLHQIAEIIVLLPYRDAQGERSPRLRKGPIRGLEFLEPIRAWVDCSAKDLSTVSISLRNHAAWEYVGEHCASSG